MLHIFRGQDGRTESLRGWEVAKSRVITGDSVHSSGEIINDTVYQFFFLTGDKLNTLGSSIFVAIGLFGSMEREISRIRYIIRNLIKNRLVSRFTLPRPAPHLSFTLGHTFNINGPQCRQGSGSTCYWLTT